MHILKQIPSTPLENESNQFLACLTSVYMGLKDELHQYKIKKCLLDIKPFCTDCNKCGEAKGNTLHSNHKKLYNQLLTASGLTTRTYSFERAMNFIGFEYALYKPNDQLIEIIQRSIDRGYPVIVKLSNSESVNIWNIIIGYDDQTKTFYGYDGYNTYWRDVDDLSPKESYLEDFIFESTEIINNIELAVVITDINKQKSSVVTIFNNLINDFINEQLLWKKNFEILDYDINPSMENKLCYFNNCVDLLYDYCEARYDVSNSMKVSFIKLVPQKHQDTIMEISRLFVEIHDYCWDVFGVLGDKYEVFGNPVPYLEKFSDINNRKEMKRIMKLIQDTGNRICSLLLTIVVDL